MIATIKIIVWVTMVSLTVGIALFPTMNTFPFPKTSVSDINENVLSSPGKEAKELIKLPSKVFDQMAPRAK